MNGLITRRLRLEPVAPAHAAETAAAMTPAVAAMLFSWPSPMSIDQAADRIRAARAGMRIGGERHWAIIEGETEQLIGWISLLPTERTGHREIGFWLAETRWGRGLAPEAIRAVIGHAQRRMGVVSVVARARPDNGRSIRALVKVGMRPTGRTLIEDLSGASIEHLSYELPEGVACRSAQPAL